jgi:hypothetical protein
MTYISKEYEAKFFGDVKPNKYALLAYRELPTPYAQHQLQYHQFINIRYGIVNECDTAH